MKRIIITIDGPAASGKGTIAKYIKNKFNYFHIDSGILYRKIAKILFDNKVNIKNYKELASFIKNIDDIDAVNKRGLRSTHISKISSEIAKINLIRNFINLNQRKIVKKCPKKYKGIVIDGRDIGSVVFKNAQIKLYIITNPTIRAKRRYKELIDLGEKTIYSNVLKEIKLRDKKDKNRKNSPLVIPKGAIIINNSDSLYKTRKIINQIIDKR